MSPGSLVYADLPDLRASDSTPATIPLNILSTTARPDNVFINGHIISLLELTIPIDTKEGLNNARERKLAKMKYIYLPPSDLRGCDYFAELETVEIGSLGHFSVDMWHHYIPS